MSDLCVPGLSLVSGALSLTLRMMCSIHVCVFSPPVCKVKSSELNILGLFKIRAGRNAGGKNCRCYLIVASVAGVFKAGSGSVWQCFAGSDFSYKVGENIHFQTDLSDPGIQSSASIN